MMFPQTVTNSFNALQLLLECISGERLANTTILQSGLNESLFCELGHAKNRMSVRLVVSVQERVAVECDSKIDLLLTILKWSGVSEGICLRFANWARSRYQIRLRWKEGKEGVLILRFYQ